MTEPTTCQALFTFCVSVSIRILKHLTNLQYIMIEITEPERD